MSRRSALHNLLGVNGPVSPSEYPAEITLPENIHTRTLEAVEGTAVDGRERSARFNYEFKRWTGGLTMKGTKLSNISEGEQRARVNRLHLALALFSPSHVHVHTHPQPREMLEAIVDKTIDRESAEGHETTPEMAAYIEKAAEKVARMYVSLPSSGDVYNALRTPLSSVGQIVASEGGTFLWVHRNTRDATNIYGKTFKLLSSERRRVAEKSYNHIDEVDTDIEVALPHPSELDEKPVDLGPIRDSLIMSRVQALDPAYVCYFSENLENPRLTKLENKAGEL
jgi:hypothetical protein